MKKKIIISIAVVLSGLAIYLTTGFNAAPSASTISSDYVVLAWNDLGMHCANADFSDIVILPPYNNFNAQVVKRGDASQEINPEIISSGLEVFIVFQAILILQVKLIFGIMKINYLV